MVRAATATIILGTWERAYGLGPVARGLALLSLARPQEPFSQLAELSIGQRDAALLDLRASLFGSQVQSLDTCPRCGDKIEVSFSVDDIRVAPTSSASASVDIEVDGQPVTIRPATSADLIVVESEASPGSRRESLLRRCVSTRRDSDDEPCAFASTQWRDEGLKTIVDKLAEADPQADVRIALDCSRCSHVWSSRFDIASYLWSEIDAWAQRLLAEVHSLAFAYGWTERDILSMTPWRRQIYMGMLRR